MQQTDISGVFKQKDKLFTINPEECKGIRVYNERLVRKNEVEYRSWNPYRSKFAAAIMKGVDIDLNHQDSVLYLGAAMGTTVSHIADIVTEGVVFAVEHTALAMQTLLTLSQHRNNVMPILADAFHPDRYALFVDQVDMVYQDISQRNQAEIFIENICRYLKKTGVGILMVKARSINVSIAPKEVYAGVCADLEDAKLTVVDMKELQPFDKDHAVIVVSQKK